MLQVVGTPGDDRYTAAGKMLHEIDGCYSSESRCATHWKIPVSKESSSKSKPHPRHAQKLVVVQMYEKCVDLVAIHDHY